MCYCNACTVHLWLFLFQPNNAQIYIYITKVSRYIMYTLTSMWHNPMSTPTQFATDQHTKITKGMYLHSQTHTLAQDIITQYRVYCIVKRRPNYILINFNIIILWKCNFNSFNFKKWCNSRRHKYKTPWGCHTDVETCRSVHYIKRYCCVIYLYVGWLK
jgi:hypothetical protein